MAFSFRYPLRVFIPVAPIWCQVGFLRTREERGGTGRGWYNAGHDAHGNQICFGLTADDRAVEPVGRICEYLWTAEVPPERREKRIVVGVWIFAIAGDASRAR